MIIAAVLIGAWVVACGILFHLSVTDPQIDRDNPTQSDSFDDEASQREFLLNNDQGHTRRESAGLSVSLVEGRCVVSGMKALVLDTNDSLFTALQTGTPSLANHPLTRLTVGSGTSSVQKVISSEQDAIRTVQNSSTATVIYRTNSVNPSVTCSPLEVEYVCSNIKGCPSMRSLALTVGPGLRIEHIAEGTPEIQEDNRVTFIDLAPHQDIKVSLGARDRAALTYPTVFDKSLDFLDDEPSGLTSVEFILSVILIPPLVIFALSRIRREFLDKGTRVVAAAAICSTALMLVILSLGEALYESNAPDFIPTLPEYVLETAVPPLALLALLSVFVALPLTLSILVARRRKPPISHSSWILITSIAAGPTTVVAVTESSDHLGLKELTLAIVVAVLPILMVVVLVGASWDLIMMSAVVGFMTALFTATMLPGGRINGPVLVLAFSLMAIPLCALSAGRRTGGAALPAIIVTTTLIVELSWYSYWLYDELDHSGVAILDASIWAAIILQVLELGIFLLLVSAMIEKPLFDNAITADGRCIVMYLSLICASVNYFFDFVLVGIVLAVALSTLLFGFFVIRDLPDPQGPLWQISTVAHKRLVAREARRRTLFKVSRDHARAGKGQMSEGTYDLRVFDNNQRVFDQQSDPRQSSGIARHLSLPEAALGSVGGFTPRQNARAASAFALIVFWPVILSELAAVWSDELLVPLGVIKAFRWVIYACIFGYYYPAIRGTSPTSKSLVLFVAVAVPEITLISTQVAADVSGRLTIGELVLPAAVRLGQAAALCFGLGLFWERRLVQAAGLGWGRIRDFRALRGLVTPVVTIVIAVSTAIATGIAGATLTSIVQPPDSPRLTVAPPTPEELGRK